MVPRVVLLMDVILMVNTISSVVVLNGLFLYRIRLVKHISQWSMQSLVVGYPPGEFPTIYTIFCKTFFVVQTDILT